MQIHCNPIDLLYIVGSPCYVIFILINTFGSKHVEAWTIVEIFNRSYNGRSDILASYYKNSSSID